MFGFLMLPNRGPGVLQLCSYNPPYLVYSLILLKSHRLIHLPANIDVKFRNLDPDNTN